MKLETKLGIYAIGMIVSALLGLAIFMYPFGYEDLDQINTNSIMLSAVVGSKVIGLILMYLAQLIQRKHFNINQDENN